MPKTKLGNKVAVKPQLLSQDLSKMMSFEEKLRLTREEGTGKVAINPVSEYPERLKPKSDWQLIRPIMKRGATEAQAREIAPLVDDFIVAALAKTERTEPVLDKPPVPTVAPALYKSQWVEGVNNSEQFLKDTYGPWLRKGGGLYLNVLRKLDSDLVIALGNAFRGRRAELLNLIPTKSASVDDDLEAAGMIFPNDPRELARLASAAARRVMR